MSFRKQLERRLPNWIQQGWVTDESARRILDDVIAGESRGPRYLTLAFSLLGVILIGSGVITFFAANWDSMAKLTKLAVLFASMWTAYALSGVLGRRELPLIGGALLLLGVILFGSNIMLIAQIYHISAHYPDGVMVWALGGLLTAWLMRSQPALVAALGLGVLWTGMESQGFGRAIHWPFLLFLAAALPPVFAQRWKVALHVALIGLLAWSWLSFLAMADLFDDDRHGALYLDQVYFLAYLALFLMGLLLHERGAWRDMAATIQKYASFAALATLYLLTFPDLRELGHGSANVWWLPTLAALALVAVLAGWHWHGSRTGTRPAFLNWGLLLLGTIVALLLVNLAQPAWGSGTMALLFNLAYFAGLLWLLYAAIHLENRALVNQAFFFFAITLLARYLDTFWSLMDRSLFFMGGGLLLLGGGYWLERQRRKLTRQIKAAHDGEVAS